MTLEDYYSLFKELEVVQSDFDAYAAVYIGQALLVFSPNHGGPGTPAAVALLQRMIKYLEQAHAVEQAEAIAKGVTDAN